MEATENQGGQAPAAESVQPAAQPNSGVSGGTISDAGPSEETRAFRDFLRSDSGAADRDPTSKPDDAATAVQSAPQGDEATAGSERGSDGRFIPRRGIPKAVQAAEERVADLEQRLASLDPGALKEQVRAELLAEQQRQAESSELDTLAKTRAADVARYRTLIETPDDELSVEDYHWREDFKGKLKSHPEVEALHGEYARQRIEAAETEREGRESAFLSDQARQVGRVAQQYGVSPDRWKAAGTTYESMTADVVDAVRAPLLERIRALEEDLGQFRLTGARGLSAARSGLNGGASSSGAPSPMNENALFRGWLHSSSTTDA